MPASPPQRADPVDQYRHRLLAIGGGPDELVPPTGSSAAEAIRDAVTAMGRRGLLAARAETARLAEDDGITYGLADLPADDEGHPPSRPWHIDPLPVVIDATEWRPLERGLQQRAVLLDAILDDVYRGRRLIRRGLLPPEIIVGHPGFLPQLDGVRLTGPSQLVLTATDLGRDADGTWRVFGDRTAAPSGAGYAMATRRIVTTVMAGLHRNARLARLRGFFHLMTRALQDVAPAGADAPRGVLLGPGATSETNYEHGFLASLLGFTLVEADDLIAREGHIHISAGERSSRVDVILRRTDAEFCDPLELRADSRLGVAGLVEAARLGNTAVVNPLGAGVLESAALQAFLPGLCRALLGEDLLLPATETFWCGDAAHLRHALDTMDHLVFKPVAGQPGAHAIPGWRLSRSEQDDLRRRVTHRPGEWTAQDPLPMSTAPVITANGLEPRRFVLRTFGVSQGGRVHIMPGGLGRVAPDPDSVLVSNAAGALAKDVWVLADQSADAAPTALGSTGASRAARPGTVLAPRVADNLFWLGRYAERVEATARLLRVTDDLVEDNALRSGTLGGSVMQAMVQAALEVTGVRVDRTSRGDASPLDAVRAMVLRRRTRGTVRHGAARLVAAAAEVRDNMPDDLWRVLSNLDRTLAALPPDEARLQPQLDSVIESTLALSGILAESLVRDESWGFIDAGVRLERAVATLSLIGATLTAVRPPALDGQVAEAVLSVGESTITHRRRTVQGVGPVLPTQSAILLLLLDPANPRSVAFQLTRLATALRVAGDPTLAARLDPALSRLQALDAARLCEGDRDPLTGEIRHLTGLLEGLSDALTRRHFRRHAPTRTLPTDWAPAVGDVVAVGVPPTAGGGR